MLTLFKRVEVINKENSSPDYVLVNGDSFSDEKFWIELFNKEKDIHIVIKDNIEYMKFVIKFYKTILENISEKELYILYHLSLCKEFIEPQDYDTFIKYYNEEKYILSEMAKYRIYPELPVDFFVSSILSGNNNEIINERIKEIYYEYVKALYERHYRKTNNNIAIIKKYSSNDFSNLYKDLKHIKNNDFSNLHKILLEIKTSPLDEETYNLLSIIVDSLENNDLILPLKNNIKLIKENYNIRDILYDTDYYRIYNKFIIQYIYELYYENDIKSLKRISLTWI